MKKHTKNGRNGKVTTFNDLFLFTATTILFQITTEIKFLLNYEYKSFTLYKPFKCHRNRSIEFVLKSFSCEKITKRQMFSFNDWWLWFLPYTSKSSPNLQLFPRKTYSTSYSYKTLVEKPFRLFSGETS